MGNIPASYSGVPALESHFWGYNDIFSGVPQSLLIGVWIETSNKPRPLPIFFSAHFLRNNVACCSKLTEMECFQMIKGRTKWSCGLSRGTAATRVLGWRVRIPPGAWMSVSCEYRVLSGRGLCIGLIIRPEDSYRVWCVWVWSCSPIVRRPWPTGGCCKKKSDYFRNVHWPIGLCNAEAVCVLRGRIWILYRIQFR